MNNPPVPTPRSLSNLIDQLRDAAATASINKMRLSEVNRRLSGQMGPPSNVEAAGLPDGEPLLARLAVVVDQVAAAVESIMPELAIAEDTVEIGKPKADMTASEAASGPSFFRPSDVGKWTKLTESEAEELRAKLGKDLLRSAKPKPRAKKAAPARKAPARRKR